MVDVRKFCINSEYHRSIYIRSVFPEVQLLLVELRWFYFRENSAQVQQPLWSVQFCVQRLDRYIRRDILLFYLHWENDNIVYDSDRCDNVDRSFIKFAVFRTVSDATSVYDSTISFAKHMKRTTSNYHTKVWYIIL